MPVHQAQAGCGIACSQLRNKVGSLAYQLQVRAVLKCGGLQRQDSPARMAPPPPAGLQAGCGQAWKRMSGRNVQLGAFMLLGRCTTQAASTPTCNPWRHVASPLPAAACPDAACHGPLMLPPPMESCPPRRCCPPPAGLPARRWCHCCAAEWPAEWAPRCCPPLHAGWLHVQGRRAANANHTVQPTVRACKSQSARESALQAPARHTVALPADARWAMEHWLTALGRLTLTSTGCCPPQPY